MRNKTTTAGTIRKILNDHENQWLRANVIYHEFLKTQHGMDYLEQWYHHGPQGNFYKGHLGAMWSKGYLEKMVINDKPFYRLPVKTVALKIEIKPSLIDKIRRWFKNEH